MGVYIIQNIISNNFNINIDKRNDIQNIISNNFNININKGAQIRPTPIKDFLLLFDKNEKLKRIINNYEFFKDTYKTTTKGEVTFEFRIKDNVTDIKREDKIGIFKEDGTIDLLIVDQIESETVYSTEYKVTCLHDFYSIQEEKAVTQWESKSISIRNAINEMLKDTSYELGECVERALRPLGPYLFKNVLWCIQDIIKEFGVEVTYSIELDVTRTKILKKKLNIVNALGSDTGIRCSTDLNVSKIKRVEKSKFYTVMYGCGAEYQKDLVKYKYSFKDISSTDPLKPKGLEYVEDKEAIEKYGRRIGIFEDGRIKDAQLLLKRTWESLKNNNKPLISYELELQELKFDDGYEHLNFKLGDLIILHNTLDNSSAKFRIIEYSRQVSNPKNVKVTIGEQIKGLTSGGGSTSDNNGNLGGDGDGGTIIDPGEGDGEFPPLEDLIPDTLPNVPVVEASGLWAMIDLSWTYEGKMYYNYEVYASKIKDFEPTVFNMIFSGQASSYLHEVEPAETWYYRVRAINSHGSTTEFSEQVEASTTKLSDAAKYFEELAIGHALIKDLDADKITVGKLKGNYIDAKNLAVTDGNGKKTLHIDSWGNVALDVNILKIHSQTLTDWNNDKWNSKWDTKTQTEIFNKLTNSGLMKGIFMENGQLYINASYLRGVIIEGMQLKTIEPTDTGGVWIKKDGLQLGSTSMHYVDGTFKIEANRNVSISSRDNIYILPAEFVQIDGRLNASRITLGDGESAYINYSNFYSPWIAGYIETWATRLNAAILLGTPSGNLHVITKDGEKGGIYANVMNSYTAPNKTKAIEENIKATDIIENAVVIDECVIPKPIKTHTKNENMDKYISYNEETQMYDMNINNTISLLWGSIQELKEKINKLESEK